VIAAAALAGVWAFADAAAQTSVQTQTANTASLVGAWTLNKDLTDSQSDSSSSTSDQGQQNGYRNGGGGGRRRGGFGGGGFGGGGGGRRGGGGTGQQTQDPEQAQRMRDALRDLMNPPDHLTIVQTDTMVILTGPDGHTTRLSPDGKKIKDDSTKLERKTKWDAGKLVSEINGLPNGKFTQTFSVDPETHQLKIALQNDNKQRPISASRIYDADAK